MDSYDAIIIGAGHAGIEASHALANLGHKVLTCTISLDSVGYLACNPSIGGTAKAHLVREVDALGGVMGRITDRTATQIRMLNASKGMAVQSLRAQVDKYKYHFVAKKLCEKHPNISLRQCQIVDIQRQNDSFVLTTTLGQIFCSRAVIVCCGVYLDSEILIGEHKIEGGPAGFVRSFGLSDSLKRLGFCIRRFKTGTPARVHRRSIDTTKLQVQHGDEGMIGFSDSTSSIKNKDICYLGYTNMHSHDIIRSNLHLTFKYNKNVHQHSIGARYCPSIEDKVVKFTDKIQHQFFLESEGLGTQEMYVQGLSTSLPVQIQQQVYRSIAGLENVEILRDAYAIEYDCIDSTELNLALMSKSMPGLFFAGQVNGTSGYEEAAAQGIVAGINCALWIQDKPFAYFDRYNSYIGVMIDDLVSLGTQEPYRMMTSRAEQRLRIRQDNAAWRMTPLAIQLGLIKSKHKKTFERHDMQLTQARQLLDQRVDIDTVKKILDIETAMSVRDFVKREQVTPMHIHRLPQYKNFAKIVIHTLVAEIKYEGYIARLDRELQEVRRLEDMVIRINNYEGVPGLSNEAVEKLSKIRPHSIGQAGRISGVTAGDINALIIYNKKLLG